MPSRTTKKPTVTLATTLADRVDQKVFDAIYSRALVYNTCCEDPAIDRQALDIDATDHLLVITSAGCNVLDYALVGPERIHAVDANPRQNALLELKLAAIRRLEFEDFFTDRLHFHPELAGKLQARDRVHTYAGFHIADVRV